MSDQVKAEYEATWHCPKCGVLGDDGDKGLTHQGEYIDVTCYDCGHEYEVTL